jgi:hypothetical protein
MVKKNLEFLSMILNHFYGMENDNNQQTLLHSIIEDISLIVKKCIAQNNTNILDMVLAIPGIDCSEVMFEILEHFCQKGNLKWVKLSLVKSSKDSQNNIGHCFNLACLYSSVDVVSYMLKSGLLYINENTLQTYFQMAALSPKDDITTFLWKNMD